MRNPKNTPLLAIAGFLALAGLLGTTVTVQAQLCSTSTIAGVCFGPATHYNMKFDAFRLSTDGTVANSVVLADTQLPFDVGTLAAAPGQQVATWIAGKVVAPGTYTHFIMDIVLSATASGNTTVSDGRTCTATNATQDFTIPTNTNALNKVTNWT